MLISCEIGALVLDSESTGRLLELVEHAVKLRIEASLLGGSELGRNNKVGKAHQCIADVLETFFELVGVG
jgi:hypothetical protein